MRSVSSARLRTLDLTYISLFSVLMAVCAWVSVPMPKPFVPFTLQTFAVFSAALCLGGRRACYSVVVYLLLGAAGLPVFTGFRGGPGVLFDVTGGYLFGFVAIALVYGLVASKPGTSLPVRLAACVLGLAVCYAFGTAWFVIVYTSVKGPVGVLTALGWCVFPFLLPDALKLCLATLVSRRVAARMK